MFWIDFAFTRTEMSIFFFVSGENIRRRHRGKISTLTGVNTTDLIISTWIMSWENERIKLFTNYKLMGFFLLEIGCNQKPGVYDSVSGQQIHICSGHSFLMCFVLKTETNSRTGFCIVFNYWLSVRNKQQFSFITTSEWSAVVHYHMRTKNYCGRTMMVRWRY